MKEQERKPWLLSFVSISRHGQQEGGGAPLFVEVWAFWFLDTESERERTVKDNVARTSTATRRVGCCPRGTSRIRSFLGSTPSTPLTLSSVHHVLFFFTLLCLALLFYDPSTAKFLDREFFRFRIPPKQMIDFFLKKTSNSFKRLLIFLIFEVSN